MTRGIILAVLLAAIGYTIYASVTKEEVEVLATGDEAPNFELVDLEGNTHRLSDYRGEGVLLNFWGTWCPPCKKEFPAIERQYKSFEDQGVNVLAINIAQSKLEVQNYINELKLTFPVAIDKTRSVMTTYNVGPLPTTILIDENGVITQIITGEMTEAQIKEHLMSITPKAKVGVK